MFPATWILKYRVLHVVIFVFYNLGCPFSPSYFTVLLDLKNVLCLSFFHITIATQNWNFLLFFTIKRWGRTSSVYTPCTCNSCRHLPPAYGSLLSGGVKLVIPTKFKRRIIKNRVEGTLRAHLILGRFTCGDYILCFTASLQHHSSIPGLKYIWTIVAHQTIVAGFHPEGDSVKWRKGVT